MSEYLSKKAVLEFIKSRKAKFAGSYKDIEYGAYLELETIETHIESGVFDANGEVQRLREALDSILNGNWTCKTDEDGLEVWYTDRINPYKIAAEALSTTTEPTGPSISKTQIENIKKMFNDPAYNGIYRSGIFNVLEELGITIPGINAPEGDGNDV